MSNDESHPPNPHEALVVSSRNERQLAVVVLQGELDLHGCGRVASTVGEVLSDSVERLEIDLSGLDFIDSAGLRAIIMARDLAMERQVAFELSGVSERVVAVIEMAGLGDTLLPR